MEDRNVQRIPAWLVPPTGEAGTGGRGRGQREESRALAELIAGFRTGYPQEWEQLRLTPLQHGLQTIIEKLRTAR